jgi:unsaturated rhamnogalacturonyl hydrolase
MRKKTTQILLALLILGSQQSYSQSKKELDLKSWPAGYSPIEVGKRVVTNFLPRPNMLTPQDTTIHYAQVCTWYGGLTFAKLANQKDLQQKLISKFDTLMLPVYDTIIPKRAHVDWAVFSVVPLEIYIQTKDPKYLNAGLWRADKQWEKPLPNGMSDQTRYWIDDMYMISALQTQAHRATKKPVYLERAALEMVAYLDTLQKPNGLFHHGTSGTKGQFYWGRGNGWMAAGMTELLRELPKSNPHYTRIMKGYLLMMDALRKTQDAKGMWHQLVDFPDAWEETSSTGMFTFAMITGVKNGWLDKKTYTPVARKGWMALVDNLDQNGAMQNVCAGMGQRPTAESYLSARKAVGDYHGQAPMLWCASALLR